MPTLQNLKKLKGPQFLHVITRKGQGYKLAEADPILYHGVSKFDHTAGIQTGKASGKRTYTQVFGDWLCDMAARDPRLVAITPAMREGSGLVRFAAEYPDRYHDVGIAEQHALTFAAGLACEARNPSSPSTRLSCSAPTTNSSTTLRCRTCRWCWPSTAPAWSAPTAPPTTAPSTSTCSASPTW